MNAPPPRYRAPYSQRRSNSMSTTSSSTSAGSTARGTGACASVSELIGSEMPAGTALQVLLARLADGLFDSMTCQAVLAMFATSLMLHQPFACRRGPRFARCARSCVSAPIPVLVHIRHVVHHGDLLLLDPGLELPVEEIRLEVFALLGRPLAGVAGERRAVTPQRYPFFADVLGHSSPFPEVDHFRMSKSGGTGLPGTITNSSDAFSGALSPGAVAGRTSALSWWRPVQVFGSTTNGTLNVPSGRALAVVVPGMPVRLSLAVLPGGKSLPLIWITRPAGVTVGLEVSVGALPAPVMATGMVSVPAGPAYEMVSTAGRAPTAVGRCRRSMRQLPATGIALFAQVSATFW